MEVIRAPAQKAGTPEVQLPLKFPIVLTALRVQAVKPMTAVGSKSMTAIQSANASILHPEGTASSFASPNSLISSTSIAGSGATISATISPIAISSTPAEDTSSTGSLASSPSNNSQSTAALIHSHANLKPLIALIVLLPIAFFAAFAVRYWARRKQAHDEFGRIESYTETGSVDKNVTPTLTHPKSPEAFGNRMVASRVSGLSNNSGERDRQNIKANSHSR